MWRLSPECLGGRLIFSFPKSNLAGVIKQFGNIGSVTVLNPCGLAHPFLVVKRSAQTSYHAFFQHAKTYPFVVDFTVKEQHMSVEINIVDLG